MSRPRLSVELPTFFGGFIFSYIREKTGSIVAPAIVHGLPQAPVYLLIWSF
jgi:membrane protease YdiL (CAAX protease family)